jgi:alkylhydroperoxidase/carboxymuconolactone decarboxylase family protein YurZ
VFGEGGILDRLRFPPRSQEFTMRTLLARLAMLAALGVASGLGGCSGVPVHSDAANAQPGVTVYGSADVGWGRVGR